MDSVKRMAETAAFLFADLEGSTRLLSSVGPESYGLILSDYRNAVIEAASREGGKVVDEEGDGLFLIVPTVAGALRAAAEAQRALHQHAWPQGAEVKARMGIHAGEAHETQDGYVGLDIHRTARVTAAAWGGQVLVSEAGRILGQDGLTAGMELKDLGEHRLKDLERPQHLHQLVVAELPSGFPPLRTLETIRNNLPLQVTSFVGRELELGELARLVGDARLVSLTGVGGAGKTRLAVQTAAALLERFPDGVWMVELASLADPGAVPDEVARVLGIRQEHEPQEERGTRSVEERVVEYLKDKATLVLLDNCEHLLEACARLCDVLLHSCPDVQVIVTSREGLGIAGERLYQVPSLRVPDSPDDVEADAVHLFLERARAATSTFTLTDKSRPSVARICRRLDGIPLAIELAAARTKSLGVDELAARLEESFRLLTGGSRTALPRQRTLEAAIDWSYELLSAEEASLFAALSVFSGGFTLEAVEEVCSGDDVDRSDTLEILAHLVDKSLVLVDESPTGTRYRLLEPLRQYSQEKLVARKEAEAFRRRHRDCFLQIAEWAEQQVFAEKEVWERRVFSDHDNLQAALEWSLAQGEMNQAAPLAHATAMYWLDNGQTRRAVSDLRTVLEHSELGYQPEREAILRVGLSRGLARLGDDDGGLNEAKRARDLTIDRGPSQAKVWSLFVYALNLTLHVRQDPGRAIEPAREALHAAREMGNRRAEARAHYGLWFVLTWLGRFDEAQSHLRELEAIADVLDDLEMRMFAFDCRLTHCVFARDEEGLQRVTAEIVRERDLVPESSQIPLDWLNYALLMIGNLRDAEESIEQMSRKKLEGTAKIWLHHNRGELRFMQGRLADAAEEVAQVRRVGLMERWRHDLLTLEAAIAATGGDLEGVRRVADEYLSAEVYPSEEVMKAGVLHHLVRAEIEAALRSQSTDHQEHTRRANEALDAIRELIKHRRGPSPQMEDPESHLRLAEAEISRLTRSDPGLWRKASKAAFCAYWKLYARWRLAEALLEIGRREEGASELRAALDRAHEMGAELIREEAEALGRRLNLMTSGARGSS